jgi:A/G-specific adenine glycosylase
MMQTEVIPYKTKKPKVPHIDIGIGIVLNKMGEILIAKRPDEKMLGGLWEFPGGKKETNETIEETIHREFEEEVGIKIKLNMPLKPVKHAYSHFKITLHSWIGEWISGTPKPLDSKELKWVLPSDLCNYAFPKANRKLIDYILEQV